MNIPSSPVTFRVIYFSITIFVLINLSINLASALEVTIHKVARAKDKALKHVHETAQELLSSLKIRNLVTKIGNETLRNLDLTNQDIYLNGTALARKHGVKVEEHEVVTKDGYILLLVRFCGTGNPILIIHGILLSSDDWITPGPKIGIPYLLLEQGYDVWIGNVRGNTYSKKHETLSTKEPKFWNFSYHEIGIFDLPAMIDYTLAVTKREQLVYIGVSQGTTSFFIMASERPDYNTKVSLMIALAPISVANFISTLFVILRAITNNKIETFFKNLRRAGIHEFLPREKFAAIQFICSQRIFHDNICRAILDFVAGYNGLQAYHPTLSEVYSHIPSGCATKQFEHYGQSISSHRFAKFDYGPVKNMKLYSQKIPPLYPIHNISTPIAMFYAMSDKLAPPPDVIRLRHQLPNVVKFYKVPLDTFGHLDFIYGKDIKKLVFRQMLKLIKDESLET